MSTEFEYRKLINDLTSDIIKDYSIRIPIDEIEDIVNKLGGIIETDYTKSEYADGIIEKHGNVFKIVIPRVKSNNRKKYIIATQLGHLFLHMQYQIDSHVWNGYPERAHYSNRQEKQAKDFGLALLMPRDRFKDITSNSLDDDKVNMTTLANYFKVSTDMAILRGRFLWLID